MTELHRRMLEELQLRNYSRAYIHSRAGLSPAVKSPSPPSPMFMSF
jgi:hypothetical protein